jgi:putative PIN family toxin of toxin-antitoxin system
VPVVAVVDTNVLVSAFINPRGYPAQVVEAARVGRFNLITSPFLYKELQEVLARPRILRASQSSTSDAEQFAQFILELSESVAVTGDLRLCRDRDDDIVLETALVGNAPHVVSRDEDIVRSPELMRQFEAHGIRVTTVSRFLREIKLEPLIR